MKRIISLALVLIMTIAIIPMNTSEVSADVPSLNSKSVYKVNSYKSGDCLLCANAYMLKRMAILLGSESQSKISNSALRKYATVDGVNEMNGMFTYSRGGIEYFVESDYLTGSLSKKKARIKELLKTHPEGIVVWGPSAGKTSWGVFPHGVLITGYNVENGYFKAADSANNYNGSNEGITRWSDTIMRSLGRCTIIYYISSVSLTDEMDAPQVSRYNKSAVTLKAEGIRGQTGIQFSRCTTRNGTYIVKYVEGKPENVVSGRSFPPVGKARFYKARGCNKIRYTDWTGTERVKKVTGPWSNTKKYTLKKQS